MAFIFTDCHIIEDRDCIEFLLLRLDEKFPKLQEAALCSLWALVGVMPDEILKNIEEKKYHRMTPDFYDKDDRPRLLLSSIASVLGIDQNLLESKPGMGNAVFRSAVDFIRLTGEKYANAEGEMRRLYLRSWHDFYENAPEPLRKVFDEKFVEIFGVDLSKMQPAGWDEQGNPLFAVSEVAKSLGISEEEALKQAKEYEEAGIPVTISMPEPDEGKIQ